jgi:hypothetical protein
MTHFSICDIEVLFHCHCSPEVHPRVDSSAVQKSYKRLAECNLIENLYNEFENESEYRTTERGRAHIIQLCELPLPNSAWIDGNGKLIDLS